jgi:Golgi phosphoprotein 3 (GPP34)
MKVAENLLMLALAGPKDGWSPQLESALTAGVLIDLASEERVDLDETGALRVFDPTPTDRPAHDLVLKAIAEDDSEWLPSTWVHRLASGTSRTVLIDAHDRGAVSERTRRILGLWRRTEYDVTDQAHLAGLREELQRVYEGVSTEPIATAVFSLCAAAGMPKLLPNRPELKKLRQRARALPPSAIADGLGQVAAALAVVPFDSVGHFGILGGLGDGGDGGS